jgi:hypothetical protein
LTARRRRHSTDCRVRRCSEQIGERSKRPQSVRSSSSGCQGLSTIATF